MILNNIYTDIKVENMLPAIANNKLVNNTLILKYNYITIYYVHTNHCTNRSHWMEHMLHTIHIEAK